MLRRRLFRLTGIVFLILAALTAALVRTDLPRDALIAKYGRSPSQFVEIDGLRVHFRDEGRGPCVVLIHGAASSLHTWDAWTKDLARDHRVVRLDLPGFGLTGPRANRDYSAAASARVVVALMDALGIERADIAGNSLGGRIAAELALKARSRVRRLVLLDAIGLSGHSPPPVFRFARLPVLGRIVEVATPRWLIRKNIHDVYGDESRIDDAIVERYYELTRAAGNRRALLDRLRGPVDPELDDQLKELKLPVLILWGERDTWVPLSFGTRFRDGIPGASLVVFPGAGHVPMEEIPAVSVAAARSFFDAPDAAGAE